MELKLKVDSNDINGLKLFCLKHTNRREIRINSILGVNLENQKIFKLDSAFGTLDYNGRLRNDRAAAPTPISEISHLFIEIDFNDDIICTIKILETKYGKILIELIKNGCDFKIKPIYDQNEIEIESLKLI